MFPRGLNLRLKDERFAPIQSLTMSWAGVRGKKDLYRTAREKWAFSRLFVVEDCVRVWS
jgi:hypothetical protein